MNPKMIKMKHSAKVNALIIEHTNGALNVPMDFILDVKFGRETVSLFILDQGAITLSVTPRQIMHMRLFVALHDESLKLPRTI